MPVSRCKKNDSISWRNVISRQLRQLGSACLAALIACGTAIADPSSEDNAPLDHFSVTQIAEDPAPIVTLDLTVPADDVWQRVRNGFSMPNLNSPLVADRQAYYLNRPDMLKLMINRSRRYLYYIVTELEKRGMPTELALLPMVESAFNPRAYSPARALGMWQFIPSTGKHYGLEQNWYVDERRDIVASTKAALDYLQYIYEMHGDWHLALASYNWGEAAVGRAVARNKALGLPTDYSHLNMPGETRYYVPKLQALKNIIADPALFDIKIDPIPNQPYFGLVEQPATMDVGTAARLAEIPVDEFIALNPAYSRPIMPGNNNSTLVLPADKVSIFRSNLRQHEDDDKPLCRWKTYTLKKGEKLATVASRNDLSLIRLKQLNGITARTRIKAGLTLLIPDTPAIGNSAYVLNLPRTPAEPPAATGERPEKHTKHGKGKKVNVAGKPMAHGVRETRQKAVPLKRSQRSTHRKGH